MAITAEHARHEFKITEPHVLGWSRSSNGKGEVISRHPVKVANCVTAGKRENTQNYVVEPRIDVVGEVNKGLSGKVYSDDGLSPTITAGEGVKYNTKILQRGHGYNKGGEFEDVAPTITTSSYENNNHVIECDFRIRKLTERECFRLMDVPEEYIDRLMSDTGFIVYDGKKYVQVPRLARSRLYKMAGNSIVVACMYHIWRKLFIDTEIKTLTLF